MATAEDLFDPYRQWLGIEPIGGAAPDHYQLLGLPRFENDPLRIAAAADERMRLVHGFQHGPRGAYSQRLLNELAVAKLCLLSPARKQQYDEQLRQAAAFPPAGMTPSGPPAAPPIAIPPAPPIAPPVQSTSPEEENAAANEPEPSRSILFYAAATLVVALVALTVWLTGQWLLQRGETPAAVATMSDDASDTASTDEASAEESSLLTTTPPTLVLQEASGDVVLSPSTAGTAGNLLLETRGTENVLVGWSSPDDLARWDFRLIKPGFFQLHVTYAADEEAVGSRVELLIDDEWKTLDLGHCPPGEFRTDVLTVALRKSGRHSFVLRPTGEIAGALVLKSLRLAPVGAAAESGGVPAP